MTNSILADFISLFFPKYCYSCKEQLYKSEQHICLKCKHELPVTNYHLDSQNPVIIKMYGKSPIVFASAYLRFVKSGKTQQMLHQLKYNSKPEIGNVLGRWYGKELLDAISIQKIDIIIPVPLHKNKKKKRGYNQSEGFALGLSEGLETESSKNVLIRVKQTTTQTKKSKIQRWENVENIFKVVDSQKIKGKNVLLVDDIITTGSTLASCANEILDSGASSVSIATIAVAEYK